MTPKNSRINVINAFKEEGGGIVLTTYGLISSNPEVFYNFMWKYLILDVSNNFFSRHS
jgi:hypothetical protein